MAAAGCSSIAQTGKPTQRTYPYKCRMLQPKYSDADSMPPSRHEVRVDTRPLGSRLRMCQTNSLMYPVEIYQNTDTDKKGKYNIQKAVTHCVILTNLRGRCGQWSW